ncbi:hypothetical protein BDZ45DRAFT_741992 [Acephala macrosclerotiorum]|nr:hypothetical protein BDZ45DRAFT_741992 [Acephala macrosclerotiorum]
MLSDKTGEASYADILRFLFGFDSCGIRDHLIIAIHFSYEGMITKLRPSFEFGVSVLDLTDICTLLHKLERGEALTVATTKNSISTRNFYIALLVLAHRSPFSGLGKKSDDAGALRKILSYLVHGSKPKPETENASKSNQQMQENTSQNNVSKDQEQDSAPAPNTDAGDHQIDKTTAEKGEKAEEDKIP